MQIPPRPRLLRSHHPLLLQRALALLVVGLSAITAGVAVEPPPGLDTRPGTTPYLNMPPAPPVPNGDRFTAVVAFPYLGFQGAVAVRPVPGTNRLWVLEREGRIWSFEDDPSATSKTLVLDLNDDDLDPSDATPLAGHLTGATRWWCQGWDDSGLMGLTFHPEFAVAGSPNRGRFFLCYQARDRAPAIGAAPVFRPDAESWGNEILGCRNRLARFTVPAGSLQADPASEVVLIDQPDRHLWHNGGDVLFGNDGFLYLLNGDEGKSDDAMGNSQRVGLGLMAGVMRIDVDGPRPGISHAIVTHPRKRNPADPNEPTPFSGNYGIPDDNPWVGLPGVLEEFWCIGLRSPHRMTIDPPSGRIFIGDVGQGSREELDLIVKGGNYQWAYKEGHKNHRSDRQPPDYTVSSASAAGVGNVPVGTTASLAGDGVSPGQLRIGDRVRFANHVGTYEVTAVSGYPHTAITVTPALTSTVPAGTAVRRTTGLTVASIGVSIGSSNAPNDYGKSQLGIAGPTSLVPGDVIAFPGLGGSHQVIAVGGGSITIRPGFLASPSVTPPAVGTPIDRLTVFGSERAPLMDFSRGGVLGFSSIIGGYVYRGSALPTLVGKYVLGNNSSGQIVIIDPDHQDLATTDIDPDPYDDAIDNQAQPVFARFNLPNYDGGANGYRGLGGFGLDHAGEILLCLMQAPGEPTNASSGKLWRIVRESSTVIGTPIPTDLKDTGAFTPDGDGTLTSLTPAPGLIPYEVNAPLWSDNAEKRRWISVPDNQQIHFTTTGGWTFPAGTVFVKHFDLVTNHVPPVQKRRVETRLLMRSPGGGVYGVTYRWNDQGTQALLVPEDGATTVPPYTITDPDGSTRQQTWNFPSRNDCLSCHNANTGHILGVNTRQLNGPCAYPTTGITDNQLRTWSHIGLFDAPPTDGAIATLPRLAYIGNDSATREHRVRSWLDSNCSHCHRPGGVHAEFDARYDTPLALQGIVDGHVGIDLGIAGARVIAAGSLGRSLMHLRDNSLDSAIKMPPLAKNLVDTRAMGVMEQWIMSLPVPLTVALTTPAPDATVTLPGAVLVSASTNAHPDVSAVDFLVDGVVIGSDATAPYTLSWTPTSAGQFSLGAIAHASGGRTASAASVAFTVLAPVIAPTVTLTAPADGTVLAQPGPLTLMANAGDADGTITTVEFLRNGTVIASDATAPFEATISSLAVGTWSFTARATDNNGATALSAAVTVTVNGNLGLTATYWNNQDFSGVTVSRTDPVIDFDWGTGSPAAGIDIDTFSARWTGTITAPESGTWSFITTSDDGIRMWIAGQLVISNWSDHPPTENFGNLTMTAGVALPFVLEFYENGVGAIARLEWSGPGHARGVIPSSAFMPRLPPTPPVVTLISPTTGAELIAPGTVTLAAEVVDADSSVQAVEFLQNGVVVASDTSAPFTATINGLTIGSYGFSARATDSQGLQGQSATATISVIPGVLRGLEATYFDEPGFGGASVVRIDPLVAFDWGTGAPHPAIAADTFTVRWRGSVRTLPGATTGYSFHTTSDDGVRLWVAGVLVIDNWTDHGPTVDTGTIQLAGDQSYPLVMEFYENGGGAVARLEWSHATMARTVIPSDRLSPPGSAVPPTVVLTAPAAGATTTAPGAFPLSADADDSDGTITVVEFLRDGVVVASDATAPYQAVIGGLAAGTYTLAARATDAQTLMSTSTGVVVTVTAPLPPSITLTAPLDGATATAPATITLGATAADGDGTITGVVFRQDGVVIASDSTAPYGASVSGLAAGTYAFTAQATDSQGLTSTSATSTVTVTAPVITGQILREWWTGIGGTEIGALTGHAAYPSQPSGSALLTLFETPTNVMDNYGTRVRGHVVPPVSGAYTFWLAGDDNCQLFLASGPSPATKVLIASVPGWTSSREWGKYAAQQSAPITLTAGVEYYIEALHKEGGGGDNLAVGWQLPGGTQERPIPGIRLKPFDPASYQSPQVSLTAPADGAQAIAPASITITATASDPDGQVTAVEFLQNGTVVATRSAPPWSIARTGLGAGAYTFTARASDNHGQQATSPPRSIVVLNADGTGALRREWWSGIGGNAVSLLTGAPGYPGSPSGSDLRDLFEGPVDWADAYGTRMSGYVLAPVTGSYVFWIAGDDNCELWLSGNDSPTTRALIARVPEWSNSREWGKFAAQQSAPIALTAGARYWIEALQKEGGGGDNLAVGWQLPGGALERPIPGNRLMPPVIAVATLPAGWSVRSR